MSERTTIGGVVYESLGSSTSNLLLKCNGTARIQWGNKLIDLIKNGKIASEGSQELLFVVKNESDITSDGVYLVTSEESSQLWISKDGIKYNFTDTDLYISATNQQQLTVEQQQQALNNIGIYYDTLEDVKAANIKNGIVYVVNTKTLYTIYNGVIEEFEAKIKTVTVDKEEKDGEIINSSVKIILSVLDQEYLILADQRITANYSIHVKNSAQIGSESADKHQGYRLYIDGDTSFLDVDEINVRNGIKVTQYTEITFDDFNALRTQKKLTPNEWYLITDFQNYWRLVEKNTKFNRPILVRAYTKELLYKWGRLFKNQDVYIQYDPEFQHIIRQRETINGESVVTIISARGRIVWMRDNYNNEANFDFLDYKSAHDVPLATLHQTTKNKDWNDEYDKSIFPKFSHDNKLIAHDLHGITLEDTGTIRVMDPFTGTVNYTYVDFQINDDEDDDVMEMYNNDIECRGIILNSECKKFYNNTLKNIIKLNISSEFCDNKILEMYTHEDKEHIEEDVLFKDIQDNVVFQQVTFSQKTIGNFAEKIRHCTFTNELLNCTFGKIENCTFPQLWKNSTLETVIRWQPEQEIILPKVIDSSIKKLSDKSIINAEINNSIIGELIEESKIQNTIKNCQIGNLTRSIITGSLENVIIGNITDSKISNNIYNSTFGQLEVSEIKQEINDSLFSDITNSILNSEFNNILFKQLVNCVFNEGIIKDVVSYYILSDQDFNVDNHGLLYNDTKRKEIYINSKGIQIISIPDVVFYRGMIIMHSGIEPIPPGWAICDGETYEYEGVTSKTPNLKNQFIKAVTSVEEIKQTNNSDLNADNELTLLESHLPAHTHPHSLHSHTFQSTGYASFTDSFSAITKSEEVTAVQTIEGGEKGFSGDDVSSSTVNISGNATFDVSGTTSAVISTESEKTWENNPIKIEPNYYALIFIMKL